MARRTLTLTLDLEGAALSGEFADLEVGELLRLAGNRIAGGVLNAGNDVLATGSGFPLRDVNGNQVGTVTVAEVAST